MPNHIGKVAVINSEKSEYEMIRSVFTLFWYHTLVNDCFISRDSNIAEKKLAYFQMMGEKVQGKMVK